MALPSIPPNAPDKVFTGATAVLDGKSGNVPKPVAGDQLKFLRGDGTYATVTASADRRNATTSRANATAGVAPTVGEHASPIDGDTHTIILNNGNVEYYKYTTSWGLVATVVPVTFDGSHTPISRANATANVAPTVGEIPSPVEGDSASVYLNNGTIENWYRNATVWALINTITPVTSDGNSVWIPRANATTGVSPTVGEIAAPVAGDTAIVILNNGTKEYWTRTTVWVLTATELSSSNILQANSTQTANRTHDFANFDHTWNDVANFTKNVVDGSEITNLSYTVSTETAQVNFSPDVHNLVVNDGAGSSSALTITPALSKLEVNGGGLNKASFHIEDGTVGDAAGDPQLYLKTNAVSNSTATVGQVLTLNSTTGEVEFATPSSSSADTIQTAASTGTTNISAWGSVVLIPTLTGNITLVYPSPVGNIGKTIKVVQTGVPNSFTITQSSLVGTVSFTNGASELTVSAGAVTIEAMTNTSSLQVSNSVTSAANATPLSFGRVKATATLPSISYATTGVGTKVPFDTSFYYSGMTFSGTDSIIPSQSGRYRVSWFMMSGSGDMNGDGTFHVVQNGVSLGSVFVDMMQAAGVNQISNFIDVNADAGTAISLHYQPVVADAVPWNAGSYFDITQLPTAVAPVVNTLAEHGSTTLAATTVDVNVSALSWVTMSGLSVTLPTAGTYRLFWKASGEMADAGTIEVVLSGRLRNQTAGVDYEHSRAVIVGKDSPTAGVFTSVATGTGEAIVTVTGTSEIVFQTRTNALSSVSMVILGDGNARSTAYMSYEKIAGQLPSTGSTVDYVQVYRSATQTVANNSPLLFNTVLTGNIPYNTATGEFTLSANKTYRLSSQVSIVDNGNTILFNWFNVTSGAAISPTGGQNASNSAGVTGDAQSEVIFTPTVSTVVQLRNVTGASRTINGAAIGTNTGTSHAIIQQIGYSNTLGGDTNVNDQSSTGYFDIGNMRQQWGLHNDGNVDTTTVSLPAAFANTNYVVTCTSNNGIAGSTSIEAKTTVSFDIDRASTTTTANDWGWIAIGQKP